jgi:hypothetical protein
VSVADPSAVAESVAQFVKLLDEHRSRWQRARAALTTEDQARELRLLECLENEILERHARVAAIARRLHPGLLDLINLRMGTNPWNWKFEALDRCARLLKGAVEHVEETEAMLGPEDEPKVILATSEQRSEYGRALLRHGAVSSVKVVDPKEVAQELGYSDDLREDIETWLNAAGLLEFAGYGGQIYLTAEGRSWAEQGASLDSPPAGSNTNVINVTVGEGGSIGAIQAAGFGAHQTIEVVIDEDAALRKWVGNVREWLNGTETDAESRGRLLARLDDLEDELENPSGGTSGVKRSWTRATQAFSAVATNTAGSLAANGLLEAAHHLDKLL